MWSVLVLVSFIFPLIMHHTSHITYLGLAKLQSELLAGSRVVCHNIAQL